MGRKPAEFNSYDNNEPRKMASNKDYKAIFDKLDKLHEIRANNNSDIRMVYEEADDKGIDKKAVKIAYKEYKKGIPDDTKMEVNRILKAMGQPDLFDNAFSSKEEDAA